jgi:hypothetical protein
MYAVIGKIRLNAGREQKALAIIGERGVAMVRGMADREAVIGRAH